ncbi:hypothetical protein [Flavobacterium sp. ACAM 123]|nr:hypothetical protein [Flavobacterium sp. ACAM 123]
MTSGKRGSAMPVKLYLTDVTGESVFFSVPIEIDVICPSKLM